MSTSCTKDSSKSDSPSKIDEILKNISSERKYEVALNRTINVLLLGRSQTGKTTIVKTLLNPSYTSAKTDFSLTSTKNLKLYSLSVHNIQSGQNYHVNIIDTPGLKEVLQDGKFQRSNEKIMELVERCIEWNITSLNLVCFVSKAGDIHLLDQTNFETLQRFLGSECSKISCLLLTHCDEFTDKRINEFQEKIAHNPLTKPILEYCKLRFAAFGSINPDSFESMELDEETLTKVLNKKSKKFPK